MMEEGEEDVPDALARVSGFRDRCRASGLRVGDDSVVLWSREAREFGGWWRKGPRQTALVAWNERMAAKLLERASEAGVSVPGELSVVGFDSTPFSEGTVPPLTAVRQPIRAMASQAAASLVDLVEGKAVSSRDLVFPCTLDVRGSCGPARAAGVAGASPRRSII